jgi:hypothetical protein
MCAFEEQIKKKFKQTKNVIKVLFTGRWIVIELQVVQYNKTLIDLKFG